jgi:hypothetical protein
MINSPDPQRFIDIHRRVLKVVAQTPTAVDLSPSSSGGVLFPACLIEKEMLDNVDPKIKNHMHE